MPGGTGSTHSLQWPVSVEERRELNSMQGSDGLNLCAEALGIGGDFEQGLRLRMLGSFLGLFG